MSTFLMTTAATCLCVAIPLSAQTAEVVTWNSIARSVRFRNPDLAAARFTIDEAIGRMRQAGQLENPQLQVNPSYNGTSRERAIQVELNQQFPLTRRLKWEKSLSATEVESAREEIREVENQLIGDARASMVRMLILRQRRKLIDQQAALAGELAAWTAQAVKRGELSSLDACQARLEAARRATETRRLTAEEQQSIGKLKQLLGMQPGEPLVLAGSLPEPESPASHHTALRPALHVAQLAIAAAEQTTAIERAKRRPDLTVGVIAAAQRNVDLPYGAEREGVIGIQFSIPLPLWKDNRGNIAAAEARTERRRLEAVALRRNILLEAESARSEMVEWAQLTKEIHQTLLPQATAQSALAEQAWRSGQSGAADLIRSQSQLLECALAGLDAIQQFHLARVRYETALGQH